MSQEELENLAELIADKLDRSPLRRYTTEEAAKRLGLESPEAARKRSLNWKRDGWSWFCLEKDIAAYLEEFHEVTEEKEMGYAPLGVSEETKKALGLK
jgi:hypothetical protein